ncbi:MAG: hypothetical protein MUE44_33075 [Oscillatoriaceae cyanobacterium Prado104]|nr:hypothetical protein [Oscillatoriaceae cyanobacterium Prado104]
MPNHEITLSRLGFVPQPNLIEYPIAVSIANSIAGFFDTETLAFVDCQLGRGQ